MRRPFYRQNWFVEGAAVLLTLAGFLFLFQTELFAFYQVYVRWTTQTVHGVELLLALARPIGTLGIAAVAAIITHLSFSALVSQFVLPVNTPEERRRALTHFFLGASGSAILVRNGRLVGSAAEKERRIKSAGVILVDSASAIVLRTDTEFKRACGPGVVFTEEGEYIAENGTLDLRQQERIESSVRAFTRDGIEVEVDLRVVFVLDSGERSPLRDWRNPNTPPFGFNPESAYRAVYGRAYRDRIASEWERLPGLLAADVWRELLAQQDFEQLFNDPDPDLALLEDLQYQIEHRLTGWAEAGQSREYQVLKERGLRVLSVRLLNLKLPPAVEQKRILQLQEQWRAQVKKAVEDQHPDLKAAREEGRRQGELHLLRVTTEWLREQLAQGAKPDVAETGYHLVESTRRVLNELEYSPEREEIRKTLTELEVWLRQNQVRETALGGGA
ncbi:MAG: SPFH domain-containing protein [Anaerolineales bacterium]|nr:SPFH domain-containing protein [Anaerolineales bacterium]